MKTPNEMARVFIDIWYYYWGVDSEYNLNNYSKEFINSVPSKKHSLISKTQALISHDQYLQHVYDKESQR